MSPVGRWCFWCSLSATLYNDLMKYQRPPRSCTCCQLLQASLFGFETLLLGNWCNEFIILRLFSIIITYSNSHNFCQSCKIVFSASGFALFCILCVFVFFGAVQQPALIQCMTTFSKHQQNCVHWLTFSSKVKKVSFSSCFFFFFSLWAFHSSSRLNMLLSHTRNTSQLNGNFNHFKPALYHFVCSKCK